MAATPQNTVVALQNTVVTAPQNTVVTAPRAMVTNRPPTAVKRSLPTPPKATSSHAILFVGSTGAGKSTLCNYLHDFGDSDHIFVEAKPGHHASVTQTVSQRLVVVKHSLNFTGSKLVLIDTPGLNESIQRDLDHMRGLYQTLQSVDGISAIVLVIPYNFKTDIQWTNTVRYFRDAFMPLFTKGHVCVVLTHMSEDDYEKAQETYGLGFEGVSRSTLDEVNRILIEASLSRKRIAKAKELVAMPTKLLVKTSWLGKCVKTRENMLAYFSAMAPLSFKQALFPLPPVFDTKRQTAIMTLEARDSELRKTLESTNSVLRQKAEELSHTNIKIEEKLVARKAMKQELDKKKSVQQTPPEFRSGEHIFTWGKFAKKDILLHSPSEKSRVNSITHNCTLGYKNKNKPAFSNQFELTVTPDLIAKDTKEVNQRSWNWFAQVWLEYDGMEFFQKEIAALELALETLEKEITTINAELSTLTSVMNATGDEASSISTSLNEIHRLRDFLKRKTFPLGDLEILSKACPLEDMTLLSTLLPPSRDSRTFPGLVLSTDLKQPPPT